MALVLETVAKQLEDSGIIAPGRIQDFMPPKANPKSAEDLLRELYKQNLLTKFQAQQVGAGKVKALILGNYTLLDRIGAGGMGQVFKAEHRRMHRLVAIKTLPPAMMKDAESIARFQREVTAAAKLRHPNIVAADDADEANGTHFLVMEYVEGSDLSALVKKNGPFSYAKAANYIMQAAKGLEFAHGEGVIHRDIKPANLLLDKRGAVKILDMGLARIESIGGAKAGAELTSSGMVMGTVDYMAPEQALNSKYADARADIYSLGCSLYFLIAGKPTYDGDTMVAKLLAHQGQPIPSLRDVQPDVPAELESIYRKMIAKTVTDRYQKMGDVVADLERFCGGQSMSISMPQSIVASSGNELTTIFENKFSATSMKATGAKATKPKRTAKDQKKLIGMAMGGVLLGLLILAGIVVSLKTTDGTLIVEVNQPDANVQVLDADGKVEVTQKGKEGKITIGVDPGKHRLKVEKDGFVVFAKDFEIASGGKKEITAKLERLDSTPLATATSSFVPAKDFEPWLKQVAALPADSQAQAVAKRLQELNPGFDAKSVKSKVENGQVTEFEILTNITDISPVQALHELLLLRVGGEQLTDVALGHVKTLPKLEKLLMRNASVTDTGMTQIKDLRKLTELGLAKTKITDASLKLFAQLETLKHLDVSYTKVSDSDLALLTKLQKLTFLSLSGAQVSDLGLEKLHSLSTLQNLHLRDTKVTEAGIAAIQKALPNCKIEWDEGKTKTSTNSSVPSTASNNPNLQQWMKDVAALPAEKQVDAVVKKLMELNPGFDGKITGSDGKTAPKIENGVVTELGVVTDNVTDISPVRVLGGLKILKCSGSGPTKGKLSDLSPLQGMTDLEHLSLMDTNIIDSGLTSIGVLPKLKVLHLVRVATTDNSMAFVSQMPTITQLWLTSTPISNGGVKHLSRLLNLDYLVLNGTSITNESLTYIRALTKMKYLNLSATAISDDGLSSLDTLTGMASLDLRQSAKITAGGVTALQKALPKCKIEWDEAKTNAPAASQSSSIKGAGTGTAPPLAKAPFDAATAKQHQQAWAKHLGTTVETTNSVGAKMILIPPGEFLMGSTDEQVETAVKVAKEHKLDAYTVDRIQKGERPQHRVVITQPFLIGATEVTVGQFRQFVEATKFETECEKVLREKTTDKQKQQDWRTPGYASSDDHPVSYVAWNDACAFCNWLSERDQRISSYRPDGKGSWSLTTKGNGYRLPTEAEWEYACRAGTTTQYSFGDDYQELQEYAWYNKNNGGHAWAVGLKLPNSYGLRDMHGNMNEWCQDFYDEKSYEQHSPDNPTGPSVGSHPVIRGGQWNHYASSSRSAYRCINTPSYRYSNHVGFRVVRAF